MEIPKSALTGSLELDDGTRVPVTGVTGDPAGGSRVLVRFGLLSVPPGRRIAAASVRDEDAGVEYAQRFPSYLCVPRAGRSDTVTMIFGPLTAVATGDLP